MNTNEPKCDKCGYHHYEGMFCIDAVRGHIIFGKNTYAITGHNEEYLKELEQKKIDAGYHWKDDIYFKRLDDGSVRVRQFVDWNYTPHVEDWVISKADWEDIVMSMAKYNN